MGQSALPCRHAYGYPWRALPQSVFERPPPLARRRKRYRSDQFRKAQISSDQFSIASSPAPQPSPQAWHFHQHHHRAHNKKRQNTYECRPRNTIRGSEQHWETLEYARPSSARAGFRNPRPHTTTSRPQPQPYHNRAG
jgi:hypothetical protein